MPAIIRPPERNPAQEPSGLVRALRTQAAAARHRYLLVLCGTPAWCRLQGRALIEAPGTGRWLWLGRSAAAPAQAEAAGDANRHLGEEADLVVFDAHAGFDPDAFAAISGVVRGGGLLVLLTPPLMDWPACPDPENCRLAVHPYDPDRLSGRFLDRFARMLAEHPAAVIVAEGAPLPTPAFAVVGGESPTVDNADPDCRTPDQRRAVAAVVQAATGLRRVSVVLIADRGRGKSAALGIAAARASASGPLRILVTGPRRAAVAEVFAQAARLCRRGQDDGSEPATVSGAGAPLLRFLPPDALLRETPEADLVLVDEAAAVPTAVLEGLLEHYTRIVFATTVHGYEGTGRGFAVRFRPVLDRLAPGWREVRLEAPVRWASGDPLEDLVFRTLLLDAEPLADAELSVEQAAGDYRIERLERSALAADEPLLAQLFGLLVVAHYRTTPLDLRHLLDGPNLQVWVARRGRRVLATLLAAEEGGFGPDLAHEVWAGRRRPRGHLMPQTLAAHLGLEEAPTLSGLRIIRIAVHPAARRRGIGTAMVRHLVDMARTARWDMVGASFAATDAVLRFWRKAGLTPVRVGIKPETTSGARAVLVIRGVSDAGRRLTGRARQRFLLDLPVMLDHELQGLGRERTALLTGQDTAVATAETDRLDCSLVAGFAYAQRPFEPTRPALWRMLHLGALEATLAALAAPEREAVIACVLQPCPWAEAARRLGVTGRAEVVAVLRRAAGNLLNIR